MAQNSDLQQFCFYFVTFGAVDLTLIPFRRIIHEDILGMEYFYEEFIEKTDPDPAVIVDHCQPGLVLFCL